jgi:hypothetical protein
MARAPNQIEEIFVSTSVRAFAFLDRQWGFRHCGILQRGLDDPRDRETRSRYRSDRVVLDVALSHIASGLFVIAWRLPPSTPASACWDLRPTGVVDFDDFLKSTVGKDLPPLFPDLAKPIYLTDMYNEQIRKYVRIVVPRLAEAIEATAARLEKYGSPLLSGDPAAFANSP